MGVYSAHRYRIDAHCSERRIQICFEKYTELPFFQDDIGFSISRAERDRTPELDVR